MEMMHFTKDEWERLEREHPDYYGKREATPSNLDMVECGELPANYIGKRNMLTYEPGHGTVLLTEGSHFIIDD